MPFVYILRCIEGSLYIGIANDVAARVLEHERGCASRFTVKRRPVRLVYVEELSSLAAACARERQLKGWTRRKKEALISGDLALLKRL